MELYESHRNNFPPVILAGYFTLFAVIYFTGFDAAPSTNYFWRFSLFLISLGSAVASLNKWKSYWPLIGLAILFLALVEFVITMTATYDFFNTPGNVGLGTFFSWQQNSDPFYIVGLKIRAVWFFIHALAAGFWYWGKPRDDQNKKMRKMPPIANKRVDNYLYP